MVNELHTSNSITVCENSKITYYKIGLHIQGKCTAGVMNGMVRFAQTSLSGRLSLVFVRLSRYEIVLADSTITFANLPHWLQHHAGVLG